MTHRTNHRLLVTMLWVNAGALLLNTNTALNSVATWSTIAWVCAAINVILLAAISLVLSES